MEIVELLVLHSVQLKHSWSQQDTYRLSIGTGFVNMYGVVDNCTVAYTGGFWFKPASVHAFLIFFGLRESYMH